MTNRDYAELFRDLYLKTYGNKDKVFNKVKDIYTNKIIFNQKYDESEYIIEFLNSFKVFKDQDFSNELIYKIYHDQCNEIDADQIKQLDSSVAVQPKLCGVNGDRGKIPPMTVKTFIKGEFLREGEYVKNLNLWLSDSK